MLESPVLDRQTQEKVSTRNFLLSFPCLSNLNLQSPVLSHHQIPLRVLESGIQNLLSSQFWTNIHRKSLGSPHTQEEERKCHSWAESEYKRDKQEIVLFSAEMLSQSSSCSKQRNCRSGKPRPHGNILISSYGLIIKSEIANKKP